MKKTLFIIPLLAGMLVGCGSTGGSTKKDFTDAKFESLTVPYDGESHILSEVSGAPEGTDIVYQGREAKVDAGTYNATATLTKDEYNTKTLNATLTITKIDFSGIALDSVTITYDGEEHIEDVSLSGTLPSDTTTNYTIKDSKGNDVISAIDVGVYSYTVVISNKNYNTKTLNATLTINPKDFSGLTYDSVTVTYDGKDHIEDVKLVGVLPDNTTTKQTVKNSDGDVVTSAIEVGTYSYSIEITNKNFNKLTLEATLKIKAEKKDMPVFVSNDGNIYFANGLDNGYLYSLDSEETLTRIDYSSPKEFNKYNSSSVIYIAGSTFLNSVKEVSGGATSVIYSDGNIDDFVKLSNTVYYYSSNSLTSSKSGIYKVDATNGDEEPVVTKVFTGKTDNLAIYNSELYFTNGNDNSYVYKMDLSTLNTSLVLSEKVHEFTINSNKMYCSINKTLNDYIGYVDLSNPGSDPVKLTNAAGEFLVVKNNKLYFNYTDLFGKIEASNYGIWAIDLLTKNATQLLATDSINGYDVESSNSIIYIDTNNLHLYRYNVSTKAKTDLLEDFVITESTPINTGGKTVTYGNKVYYLNMYAGKTLYVYDEASKSNQQLTTNKVVDFFINEDKLYFNQVTMVTNNDLYCVDLKLGSEANKINNNDVRNMISDGTYIYASHYNWAGTSGGISRMKLDGSEYVKFSEIGGAKNFTIRDDKLYFINCNGGDNGNIEYISLNDITSTSEDLKSTNLSKNIKNVKQFIFENNNIFYIYDGTLDNSVRRTDFTSLGEGTKLASKNTNPSEIVLKGDSIYYYSYASSSPSNAGFYKVDKNAIDESSKELILGYDSMYFGTSLAISDSNNLYFLNYLLIVPPKGNAHFYQLNLNSKTVALIK